MSIKSVDKYYMRFVEKIRRIDMKESFQKEMAAARKFLLPPSGTPLKIVGSKGVEDFNIFFKIILLDRLSLILLTVCESLMSKFKLPKTYLRVFIIYFFTGSLSEDLFKSNVLIGKIESDEALDEIRACIRKSDNKFWNDVLNGKFHHLTNNWEDLYPLKIKISPMASQEDVLLFIKNKDNWKEIKRQQKLYGKIHLNCTKADFEFVKFLKREKKTHTWPEIHSQLEKPDKDHSEYLKYKQYSNLLYFELAKKYCRTKDSII